MRIGWVVVLVAFAGCSKKKAEQTPVTTGSGSAGSATVATPADAALDAAAIDAAPADPDAACLPTEPESFVLGRIGGDLVVCGGGACWTVDRAAGKVAKRAEKHMPGVSAQVDRTTLAKPNCYEDLCWPAVAKDKYSNQDAIAVVRHADGKRVAIFDDPKVMIFDALGKKLLTTFDPEAGSVSDVWFAGDLVIVQGNDAGPHAQGSVFTAAGKRLRDIEELYEGGVGIGTNGRMVAHGFSLVSATVLDGAKRKEITRKLPTPPEDCSPLDPGLDLTSEDPAIKPCVAFFEKHYAPYRGAILVDDGDGFVGLHDTSLFTLDGKLVEKSRIELPACAKRDTPEK